MTRTERKNQERAKKKETKTHVVSDAIYKQKMEDMKIDMKIDIIQELFGVVMVSLSQEFGWFAGKYRTQRLGRFLDRFALNMEAHARGENTLADFDRACAEYGVKYEVKAMKEKDALK